jgi:hypothetical protein
MQALCSTAATFWEPTPEQTTFAGIPLTFYSDLIHYILKVEVAPKLEVHRCTAFAPCVALRKTMQICLPHLSVCKMWRKITSTTLKQVKYSILKPPSSDGMISRYWSSYTYAMSRSLHGRYQAYKVIEESGGEWMIQVGCHAYTAVKFQRNIFERNMCLRPMAVMANRSNGFLAALTPAWLTL